MSFSDPTPPPPPSFLPPPFAGGDGFWPQIPVTDEDQDSNPQFDHPPPFKRPKNLVTNPPNFPPYPPPPMMMINQRMYKTQNLTQQNKGTGHIFYKTRVCTKFLEGNCRNGEFCTFAHGAEDLREPPPNWQEIVGLREKDRGGAGDDQRLIHKMKICKKFYNGEECPYGEKCNFVHIDSRERIADQNDDRENSAISIGTMGHVIGNRGGGFDQAEINKNFNLVSDGLRGSMKPTYWKTKLCSRWEITGQCPFGERCHFAHGISELQVPGARVEAELVNALTIPTKPVSVSVNVVPPPIMAAVTAPSNVDCEGNKCFSKWKGTKKINRIYADWIDDLTPPLSLPSQVES